VCDYHRNDIPPSAMAIYSGTAARQMARETVITKTSTLPHKDPRNTIFVRQLLPPRAPIYANPNLDPP